MLENSGTRTFANPEGNGKLESEVEGNQFAEFAGDLAMRLWENGREFLIESSPITGRYPKLWDQPRITELRRVTGAKFVANNGCSWAMAPERGPRWSLPTERHLVVGQSRPVPMGVAVRVARLRRGAQAHLHRRPFSNPRGPRHEGHPAVRAAAVCRHGDGLQGR